MADSTLTPEQAFNTIVDKIYMPVFFSKLAEAGIRPANEKQASDLLRLAAGLRAQATEEQVKQANSMDSVYALLASEVNGGGAAAPVDAVLKAAAADAATDPELAAAVLAYQAAAAAPADTKN